MEEITRRQAPYRGACARQRQRRRLRALPGLALAIVMVAAAGCGGGSSDDSSRNDSGAGSKPVLRIGITGAGSTLDPGRDTPGPQLVMRALAYESLIRLEADGSPSPGLAESWRYVGSGNRVFEVTLRRGAKFSDGAPVDAEAVKTWLEYFGKFNPTATNLGIDRVEVVDKWTANIRLAAPNPTLPYYLSDQFASGAIVSPRALARPKALGTQTAGAGQYVLDPSKSVAGDHYTFVPNKRYYNPSAIRYSQVTVRIITNATSMQQAAVSGQLDVAEGDAATAPAAEAADLEIVSAPANFTGLWIPDRVGKLTPALRDVRVRQAMNYAIDREALTRGLLGDYAVPSSEWLTVDGFDEEYSDHYPYDPAKAKELLTAAGYADGFSITIASPSSSGTLGDPVTQAIAKYLDDVGIRVRIVSSATQADYNTKILSGDYSAYEVPVESGPINFLYLAGFAKGGVVNYFGATDAKLDALYRKAVVADEPTPLLQAMSRRIVDQAMMLPVFHARGLYFVSKDTEGVELSTAVTRPNPTQWSPK